jgi:hypothetical protein
VEHLNGASLRKAQALPANISFGWKRLPRTNTLAYYKLSYISAAKRFITLALNKIFASTVRSLP